MECRSNILCDGFSGYTLENVTRRQLLRYGAGAAAAAGGSSFGQRRAAAPVVVAPLSEFDYAQVQLADGPAQRQFEENHQLLLSLSEDSLLRPFRVRAGQPAPGYDLGGWYDAEAFAPGCTFGQWLSALARMQAATRDAVTRDKLNRLVAGYGKTIDAAGSFYVHNRFPAYVYDKLVLGLLDANMLADDSLALYTLERTTEAALPHLPDRAYPRQETPVLHGEDFTSHCWDESYTLPENLFLAWHRTGEQQYWEMAQRYLMDREFFDPLARDENVLPGLHAYSHVNALSSAAAAVLYLGQRKYFDAARNGFRMVQEQSYASGGWGPDEHFVEPGSGKLAASLSSTHSSFETPCGAYAHFKIARYLLRMTRDSRYGDSMERVLYNTVLGAKPIEPDGRSFYYSDYNFNGSKFYHPDKWPCCSGTLPQISADYRISTYLYDRHGIYVNLYIPSTLTVSLSTAKCWITITTAYPYSDTVRVSVITSSPASFSLYFRIPAWASGARLGTSGERGDRPLTAGTFAEVRREWRSGDQVELWLPRPLRLESVDSQNPQIAALLCGPLALMRIVEESQPSLTRAELLSAQQSHSEPYSWTIPARPETRFLAFMDIRNERYSAHTRV